MRKYKVLDLFCGAGGLSIGFERNDFEVVKAIDFAKHAVETYNFYRKEKVAEVKDVKEIDDDYISSFTVQVVGASYHQELWIPAEELDNFNNHIIGKIEIIKVLT